MVNEIEIVKSGNLWYAIASGAVMCACDSAHGAALSATHGLGGEWEQLETHDGHLQRYRRKPPSDAERVAREIYALLDYDGMTEAEFVRAATPLIASARTEVAHWRGMAAKATQRVQELEAQVERLRQDAKVDAAFVEQSDSKCAMLEAALNAERLWIKQLEADAKVTLKRTAELEAQLTAERSSWSAAAMRVLVKERNDARQRVAELEAEIERLAVRQAETGIANVKARNAIRRHRDQKADDRCWMDDQELYAVLDDGNLGDNRVGSKCEMLRNCERFLKQRCESGGPWKSYAELEAERDASRQRWEQLRDAVTKPAQEGYQSVRESLLYEMNAGGIHSNWARNLLVRLEAALAEPEVPA